MTTVPLPYKAGKSEAAGNPLLQEALRYAANGWCVLPLHTPTSDGCSCEKPGCTSAGKHPRTKTGLKEASVDESTIRGWWKQWPEANVGITTGPESGICVLDVDGEDGQASLAALEALEPLPETLSALTGRTGSNERRTGSHLYFRWPVGMDLRNSAGRLAKGLDIRGAGGYIVAPPSLHSSGLRYEWTDAENTIADLPRCIVARLSKYALAIVPTLCKTIPEGQRNAALLSRAGTMHRSGMSPSAIEAALQEENRQSCSPPLDTEEVAAIAASIQRYPQGSAVSSKTRRADVRCLADVKAEKVEWLWEPYFPLKMITLLSGDPGVGKTYLALAFAASLTRGETLLTQAKSEPCNVLYLSNENSAEHVTRPRFDDLKGNASRFFLLEGTKSEDGASRRITLADVELLQDSITQHQARLVIIDPLQSYLGAEVDAHRANQTRPILDDLIRLAEKTNCAILITRHLSKGLGGSAMYRGMGSIDITGAARSELFVGREPDNPSRIIMAQSKNSLAAVGPSIAYSIGEDRDIFWHGESNFGANDLLAPPANAEERSALDEASDFLREILADGPRPVKEIQRQAEENGISKATLRRAGTRLDVERKPAGFGKGWMLSLPSVAQESPVLLTHTP